jgi:uncharacterized membrane protein required for colicin V production
MQHEELSGPTTRLLLGVICAAFMVISGIFAAGLNWLEHVPYRPPEDMSTLLGGPELALVRGLKCIFLMLFLMAFTGLVSSLFFRRPGAA